MKIQVKKSVSVIKNIFPYIIFLFLIFYPINTYISIEKKGEFISHTLNYLNNLELDLEALSQIIKEHLNEVDGSSKITHLLQKTENRILCLTNNNLVDIGQIEFYSDSDVPEMEINTAEKMIFPNELPYNKITKSVSYYNDTLSNLALIDIWYRFKTTTNKAGYLKITTLTSEVLGNENYIISLSIKKNEAPKSNISFIEELGVYVEHKKDPYLFFLIILLFSSIYWIAIILYNLFKERKHIKELNEKIKHYECESKLNKTQINYLNSIGFYKNVHLTNKKIDFRTFEILETIKKSLEINNTEISAKKICFKIEEKDKIYTYGNYAIWCIYFNFIMDRLIEASPPNSHMLLQIHEINETAKIEINDDITFQIDIRDIFPSYKYILFGYIDLEMEQIVNYLNSKINISTSSNGNKTVITIPLKKTEYLKNGSNVIQFFR